jgi:hypothetical protein
MKKPKHFVFAFMLAISCSSIGFAYQAGSATGKLTKEQIESADVSALFIGNSHTWNLDQLVARMFAEAHPDKKVCIARAPGNGFLVDHARDNTTRELINLGQWDFVILQAQKYSTTGRFSYSYDGALELSKLAQEQGARIIMFPEWSQRGKPDEHLRIDKLHQEIAAQTGATVAPIGDCWDAVIQSDSSLELHASDGNHATPLGAYLNACVFYSLLAGEEAPPSKVAGDDAKFNLIRQTVWQHVASIRPADGIYLVQRWTETRADLFPLQADEQYFRYDENKFLQLQDEEPEPVKYIGLSKTELIPFQLTSRPESIRQADGRLEIGLEFSPEMQTRLTSFSQKYLGRQVALVIGGEIITLHKVRSVIRSDGIKISRCTDNGCQLIMSKFADR